MSLKRSIVFVNKYSVPLPSKDKNGKTKGSKGSSPGAFVTQYMARKAATETLAPIKRERTDDFILRYMAREQATESVSVTDSRQLKQKMSRATGLGGVSFGYGEVSLSHAQLKAASEDLQSLFEAGHTWMGSVLSFDQEYLREHKLIPEDFQCKKRGDYRGHLDQMKLRLAIMKGMDRMGRLLYDDLRYVAVIQVDTEHVHCHIAMVDAGVGTRTADGTQKGKIGDRAKSILRRGIDSWLDEKQTVKHLTSAVGYERRNVTTYVKKWAHQQMLRESLPQFLLACLPEDRRLWRSGTNHASMRKPNRIVRQMVEEVLSREGSPMSQAMEEVHRYADTRRKREGLSRTEWQRLVTNGRDQIIERSVNSVYAMLRQLPGDALKIRTPMLDAMSTDLEVVASKAQNQDNEDELSRFGFRLRSYSSRLEHHSEERKKYHRLARSWEVSHSQGVAVDASRALYEFYLEEEEYQARCAAKYRKFLSFVPASSDWNTGWNEVAQYGEALISLESLRRDQSLRKMKDEDEAERLGREIYGQAGGRLVSRGDTESLHSLDMRIQRMRETYATKVEDLRVDLASKGLLLNLDGDPATGRDTPRVQPGAEFPFDEVKGLDLHHMRYDFSRDVPVGKRTFSRFTAAAKRRVARLNEAIEYLVASRQEYEVEELPVADIQLMASYAGEISRRKDPVLKSRVVELAQKKELLKRSKTVELGTNLEKNLSEKVDQTVRSFHLEYEQTEVENERDRGLAEGIS